MNKRRAFFTLLLLLGALAQGCATVSIAPTFPGRNPVEGGHLLLVGGGLRPKDLMARFVALADGGSIVVLPLASARAGAAGAEEARLLRKLGAIDVRVLQIEDVRDAHRVHYVEMVRNAGGVWFTGGDQVKIVQKLLDTPLLDAIVEMRERGGVVGGTSAGTACQSEIVITGTDVNEKLIAAGNVATTRGLGLIRGVIMDQHFVRRQRENRLLAVVLEHPEFVGVGVDESTAVWVKPDGTMTVLGASVVVVFDARQAKIVRRGHRLVAKGVETSVLAHGDVIDLDLPEQELEETSLDEPEAIAQTCAPDPDIASSTPPNE
ncbi:MAG: cyanophycinase [Myxococcota bacterium]|jgi:cyanophycinase|nr:cyanophycinase [Myxococcota bacterium]